MPASHFTCLKQYNAYTPDVQYVNFGVCKSGPPTASRLKLIAAPLTGHRMRPRRFAIPIFLPCRQIEPFASYIGSVLAGLAQAAVKGPKAGNDHWTRLSECRPQAENCRSTERKIITGRSVGFPAPTYCYGMLYRPL